MELFKSTIYTPLRNRVLYIVSVEPSLFFVYKSVLLDTFYKYWTSEKYIKALLNKPPKSIGSLNFDEAVLCCSEKHLETFENTFEKERT